MRTISSQEGEIRTGIMLSMFAFYGQGSDEAKGAAYTRFLIGIPIDVLQAACDKLVLTSKFLPTVSEIIAAAQSLVEESNGQRMKPWDGGNRSSSKLLRIQRALHRSAERHADCQSTDAADLRVCLLQGKR